jgi:transposase
VVTDEGSDMLTQRRQRGAEDQLRWEEDVEAHVLSRRGWTIAAIARHLGRDRKTVRAYLRGERQPGQRRRSGEDHFARFAGYIGRSADPRACHPSHRLRAC